MPDFHDRLDFGGSMDELYARIASGYGLGSVEAADVIQIGFEDFNVRLRTTQDELLVKIYSKKRDSAEIERNAKIVQVAVEHGVNHPPVLLDKNGEFLHVDGGSGLKMIVMKFIAGKTFFDTGTLPSDEQLKQIAAQAAKINAIEYDPPYLFDIWAIPNMKWMFDKTKDSLSIEGRELVTKAFRYFEAIPNDLPKCLVHGDLTKTNLIVGDDGEIYVIDFSVTNTYPRIQELAVMAANLMFDEKQGTSLPLKVRVERITQAYLAAGGVLTDLEIENVFNYALPGVAMEYMGSVNERLVGDTSDEIVYWEKLGFNGLKEALS